MLVVSLALTAVLVAGNGSSDARLSPASGQGTATQPADVPSSTPAAAATAAPTPLPAIPSELQAQLDALPEKLRNEAFLAYSSGALSLEQLSLIVTQYKNRNPNLRVGSVLGTADGVLRFEVYTTGEQAELATGEQTRVRRAGADIGLEELLLGELVMVVSTENGTLAVTIEAFGVSAP